MCSPVSLQRLPVLLAVFCISALAQQVSGTKTAEVPKSEVPSKPPTTNYLQEAAASSIFIYDGTSKPCEQQPSEAVPLLPLGSGFVVGITNKSITPPPGQWAGWKFLLTAGHVVHHSSGAIVVRLNKTDASGFTCFRIALVHDGSQKNVYQLKNEDAADITAVSLPDIPGTDPTVFAHSMLLDLEAMAKSEIRVGTNVFTVGYFYGYAGQKQNYPITKFGKISILSSERWFFNQDWHRYEEAYVIELQNTPGLSGAPVMLYGPEFSFDPFRFRNLMPMVVGIVKGLQVAPVTIPVGTFLISQGIATVEPASHIKMLLSAITDELRKAGNNPGLD